MKIRFVLLLICMLLISCSESSSTVPKPTEQPSLEPDIIQEESPEATQKKEDLAGPADIRVTDIKAVTNVTGTVTEQGCSGPRIDVDLTITNFGQAFPPDSLWDEWVTHTENARANSPTYPSVDERALFTIYTKVDFGEKWKELSIPINPNTLKGGKFGSGIDLKFSGSVDIPWDLTLHEIENYTVTSNIRQASGLMPVDTANIPLEESFEFQFPDIVIDGVKVLMDNPNKSDPPYKWNIAVFVGNKGKAPVPDSVKVEVVLHSKDGKLLDSWEDIIEKAPAEPGFVGTARSGDMELLHTPADGDTYSLSLYMLCPSEQYALISDANPENNRVQNKELEDFSRP